MRGKRISLYESAAYIAQNLNLPVEAFAFSDAIRYKSVGSKDVCHWRKRFPQGALNLEAEARRDFLALLQAMPSLRVVALASDAIGAFWSLLTNEESQPRPARDHATLYPELLRVPGTDRSVALVSSVLVSSGGRGWQHVPGVNSYQQVLDRLVGAIRRGFDMHNR